MKSSGDLRARKFSASRGASEALPSAAGSAKGFKEAFRKFCERKGMNASLGRRFGGKGFQG